MTLPRVVELELLDTLQADDPRAIHSRRDLRRINWWMGNARHLSNSIRNLPTVTKVLEVGTGDGTLLTRIAPAFREPIELHLLDMQPVVKTETLNRFSRLGWQTRIVTARLEQWKPEERFDLIIANLFLHHFTSERLKSLFGILAPATSTFLSCDPRRWRPALWSIPLLRLLRCNEVTRHDALISVRAGFRDRELSTLWPTGFQLEERPAGFASHLFMARKSP